MKKFVSIALPVLALAAMAVFTACEKGEEDYTGVIEGLTLDNFPVMDGSTSTDPLVRTIACELFGYDYKWEQALPAVTWELSTYLPENFVKKKIRCSQTHNAIMDVIAGEEMRWRGMAPPEIVFSARRMSADEREYATEVHGIEMIETPVALDALVFIAHDEVSVKSLSHKQLEDIYTAGIRNWNEVGGEDLPIVPFVRNKNSGSQELMESLVMTEPIPDGFYEEHYEDFQAVGGMFPLLTDVSGTKGGLGYTVYYYLTQIVRDGTMDKLKTLAVNGVAPDRKTIENRSYPFTAEVYMIIRSDLDRSSPAYKIYEFMQTEAGKRIVAKSGYVPY